MGEGSRKKVAVLLGSDSDLDTMQGCFALLRRFGLPYEARVISAHRTPDRLHEFAKGLEEGGYGCVIAAAGGAAHLAGVVAALTPLPVIGVPCPTALAGGLDSLLSMVQMPSGVPVAVVAVGPGGAKNAAVLAAQILALGDPALREAVRAFKAALAVEAAAKDQALRERLQENVGRD